MNIDDIKSLVEKFVSNFQGEEDFAKIKANGEDLIKTLGNFSGGLSGLAQSALGKLGLGGNAGSLIDSALSSLGNLAKTDTAKADFSKLADAIKKFTGA